MQVVVSVLLALVAGPVYEFAEATATQLLDRQGYINAVLVGTETTPPAEVPGS